MPQAKRALITGASGFLGSHMARYLYEKGFEIWVNYHQRPKKFPFPVQWVRADLTCFKNALDMVCNSRPNFIFHFAGQAVPKSSWKNPGVTYQLNVGATILLLEGAVRFAPNARVVLISSAQVYGATFLTKGRVSERDSVNPLNPYGGSKLLMELAGLNFFKCHKLGVVIARAFNHVGTEQNPNFAFADFSRQVALIESRKKRPVLNVGNTNVTRDFIHVRDAVKAYYLLAHRGKSGEIYNVGSGKGVHLGEVLKFLKKESRIPFKIMKSDSRKYKNDVPSVVADVSKLRKLGWRPSESIWEGMRELLTEWRARENAN